jgi:lipopolysaccharide/colanic/teichoic acid biosynthesis glycosyltransferase
MPNDQMGTGLGRVQVTQSTMVERDLASSTSEVRTKSTVPARIPPIPFDPERATRQRELIIQRAYRRVERESTHVTHARGYGIAKRALDLTFSAILLLVFAPIMLIVAALIRFDSPGPALFKQQRVGQNGRLFTIYKFRSMTDDAGVRLDGVHKTEADNRVTTIGRFIRKTSLDELPQLINVLRGEMSLVGPRPELPEIVLQRYEPWQYRRLAVPQGITGWWQVTGRGKKLLWKHTADDLYYVDRASFWFDIKVLFMTIGAVLGRRGAF